MTVSVFCDGSSTGRSNREGGWAYVIVRDGNVLKTGYGGGPHETNNTMEMTAAIEGIKALIELRKNGAVTNDEVVELVSDSQYTLGIASGAFNPTKNLELAAELVRLRPGVDSLRWVRGHQKIVTEDTIWQRRCDQLAKLGKSMYLPVAIEGDGGNDTLPTEQLLKK